MKPATYLTTSWDDGHPLDLRVAELLAKYGLRGTFYVPRTAEHGTMTVAQLRELSGSFEVGGHTLQHDVLTDVSDELAAQQILGSKSWLEDITGQTCSLFCPPKGKYALRHLHQIRQAGYLGVRSVEMLSLDLPRRRAGLLLLPTTVQAHPHGWRAYARNLIRRAALRNLWLYIAHGRSTDWPQLARSLMSWASNSGGVFHLWGHSWEIQQMGQWQRLEEVLRWMSELAHQASALTNWQICEAVGGQIAGDSGNDPSRPLARSAYSVGRAQMMNTLAARNGAPSCDRRSPTPEPFSWPKKVDLFGVGMSVTTYEEATNVILQAARRHRGGVVACQAVHAVVTASGDPSLRSQVNSFELVTPDGQPVRWAMNLLHRTKLGERVCGQELMLRLCRAAAGAGISVYLHGGSPAVVEKLHANLLELCPGLRIAGYESPPFRALTPQEDQAVIERINASGAGLVFLGLGCPKQDRFAFEHRSTIKAVQLCVGAAFDFHAGVKKMAPHWMSLYGLEWLYRLIQEPRRLWRRYFETNSVFLIKLAAALVCRQSRPKYRAASVSER